MLFSSGEQRVHFCSWCFKLLGWITLRIFNLCVSCWSCHKVTWRAQTVLYLMLSYRFTWPEMPNCLLESVNYLSVSLAENRTPQKPITLSKSALVMFSIFNFKLWSNAHGFRIIIWRDRDRTCKKLALTPWKLAIKVLWPRSHSSIGRLCGTWLSTWSS